MQAALKRLDMLTDAESRIVIAETHLAVKQILDVSRTNKLGRGIVTLFYQED